MSQIDYLFYLVREKNLTCILANKASLSKSLVELRKLK